MRPESNHKQSTVCSKLRVPESQDNCFKPWIYAFYHLEEYLFRSAKPFHKALRRPNICWWLVVL